MSKERVVKINNTISQSTEINGLRFPARIDYEAYFIKKGTICYPHELWSNDQLVKDVQRHWHIRGQNGCVFAQIVAAQADKLGWDSEVVRENSNDLPSLLQASIDNPKCQNLSLIFPEIHTVEQLCDTIRSLFEKKIVKITAERLFGEFVILELRLRISKDSEAWLVGFGPFDFLPKTRQAPQVEIAVRTKPKPDDLNKQLNQDYGAAHLADIPINLDDDRFNAILESTKKRTAQIIGSESRETSKAKVTFTIPAKKWYTTR
ncbi:MAG: hypothetical protein WDZ94_03910 [Patescibacteria group bacterium]